ncbi:MAG: DUF3267 domain-containing protein [Clostridia bacterium]|nr:DUF3267 domain-containing protein [Clostridia bacterium]
MKALNTLPDGYSQIYEIDLQKNKKKSLLVNGIAFIISVLMIAPMCFYIPITELFSFREGMAQYLIRFGVLLGLLIIYMVLHELVHGITMKLCGTKKVRYGFTGMYAFAGSDDYYDKKSYITIALAPVVLWGVVIAIVNFFVPREWFWVVYFLQIMNISGAAGDMYVTFKFAKMPKDILVRDHGVGMKVYSKNN